MKEGKVEFGGFILFRKILVILILKDSLLSRLCLYLLIQHY